MAGSGTAQLRAPDEAMLRVESLSVEFHGPRGESTVKAVSDVSFDVLAGETLGLVGESGCGKSSLARAVMQLPPPTAGRVILDGVDLAGLSDRDLRPLRPRFQVIFQDPISSLNPRHRVAQIVGEPATVWRRASGAALDQLVDETLEAVGLDPASTRNRRPTQFSGGQCQRICIARALVLSPELLICDEPVSALDVSIQAQILNLMKDLQSRHGLTYLMISHDLAVVRYMADTIGVMYLGKVVELGPAAEVYGRSAHHYTLGLLNAVPVADVRIARERAAGRVRVEGELPSSISPPQGCRFNTRCPAAQPRCFEEEPQLQDFGDGHYAACHFPLQTPVALSATRGATTA